MLVLDESVDRLIEERIENLDIEVIRPPKGSNDRRVLHFAIKREAPIVTRDQGDFVILNNDLKHYGIMIDKHMHLRDRNLVAETVVIVLKEHPKILKNNLVFLSSYYGQF